MLTINLLPPKESKELKSEIKKRLINFLLGGVIFSIIVFLLTLFSTFLYLKIQISVLHDEVKLESGTDQAKKVIKSENDIKGLNDRLKNLNSVKLQVQPVGTFLDKFASLLPFGAHLNNISFNVASNQLVFDGFAETRQIVLDLIDKLKSAPFLKDVNSPLANLINEANINWTMTAKVDLSKLK